jgi:uncharacterized protein YkwD
MRFFYVTEVKRYIYIGAMLGCISGFLLRFFISSFSLTELYVHTVVRTALGYPITYYSSGALFLLAIFYEFFYSTIGGLLGYVIFRLRYHKHGYTLLVAPKAGRILGIIFFLWLYGFLRIDMFNRWQLSTSPVKSKTMAINLKTIGQFFVPHIALPQFSYPTSPSTNQQYTSPTPLQTAPTQHTTTTAQSYQSYQSNPPAQSYIVQQPTSIPPTVAAQTVSVPSAQELFNALNSYRQVHGVASLTWESNIAAFAQAQASYFGETNSFTKDDAYRQRIAPYTSAINSFVTGETNLIGTTGTATHIINDVLGGSSSYSSLMGATRWTHVGIGVSGKAIVIVYGRHDEWYHGN